ncbi:MULTISPECIES: VOC family protein [Burkholderia]|uniref:VOC family protein n=1 Tax=Burkholderia TaxID=32008 RepID=UPI000552E3D7|nr:MULTISPECIES: VOC family protein [Burkholderia]KVE03565.1 methylmalonyl-CoA epimerase [Burkholderia vietnamiensis]KVF08451.1 methylmalonyl-CoA epimerase [Burkholderia vietnamiensis]KVF12858.1 methylmalonyl-CoA epimerase [Burkholderia vietnamiensis]KVF98966.1 methylmalonyl-CoA epimerase [Burkholderia vietnamiensis]KVS20577.1 methylmalonyl-CoA epimerase [Burkholderia vietnamiensis]
MRIRSTYLKVNNLERAATFWENLLEQPPNRKTERWAEFSLGEIRFGLLLNDFGDEFAGSGCVPVFEFDISDLHTFVERAKALGAKVVLDALNIETMQSVVLSDSEGHEFELCSCHE